MLRQLAFFATISLLLVTTRAAHAQRTVASTPWSVRSAGSYNIVTESEGRLEPSRLILRDSSGTLTAVLEDRDGGDPRPLSIVKHRGSVLVLRMTVPGGAMTITLARRGDTVTGTWQRENERGVVTGRALASSPSVHVVPSSFAAHA